MQLYSTQAKNVCSFVYALLCCKEWLLWIRAWGTAWGEIKSILLLFSLLYCCAATSTVARIPAQAYMFTSAGIEDVPYGNCWWISSSRLAMARSVELDRFIVPRPASNNRCCVLRLLTQPRNLQNSSVWAGFCSSHLSMQVLCPGWPCLTERCKELGGRTAQVTPALSRES